ncbi:MULTISPECIES: type II secretion system F family protein [unclassified Paenarthrobacter]|uniref:type II secretion system F family protein n=1 Tax=unclassified Paenarthrobacter TaxID=2634190 RepID=UPI003CE9639B
MIPEYPVVCLVVVLGAAAFLAFHPGGMTASVRRRLKSSLASRRHAVEAVHHAGQDLPEAPGDGLRDPAMMLELVASMLDAGAGLGRALELVARSGTPEVASSLRPVVAALAIGTDWQTAWGSSVKPAPEVVRLRNALAFAAMTGAPSAAILYAQAARERREQFRAAEKRAAALGVKLVVPLGLCSLPAFICLGIVPVLIAMMPAG